MLVGGGGQTQKKGPFNEESMGELTEGGAREETIEREAREKMREEPRSGQEQRQDKDPWRNRWREESGWSQEPTQLRLSRERSRPR